LSGAVRRVEVVRSAAQIVAYGLLAPPVFRERFFADVDMSRSWLPGIEPMLDGGGPEPVICPRSENRQICGWFLF